MEADLPGIWPAVAAVNRWLLYTSLLSAIGAALFAVLMAPLPDIAVAATVRLGRVSAVIAGLALVVAVGVGGAEMLGGGGESVFAAAAWNLGFDSSLGLSAMVGIPGLALVYFGLGREQMAAVVAGAVVATGSFLVTGHAALAAPVWLMAPVVGAHLLCAAFWLSALPPLWIVVRELPPADAGALLARFSTPAVRAVLVLVLSGLVISAVQVRSPAALVATEYGLRLLVKVALVVVIVGLAAYNKYVLTLRLRDGQAGSVGAMRRAIACEVVLMALILAAAVSLTQVAPPRTLG